MSLTTVAGGPMARTRGIADRLSFERPRGRVLWTFVLLLGALLSPDLYLPSPLPAIRLEQIILLCLIVPFGLYVSRHPEARRFGLIDAAFVPFPVAIALSIVVAPIIVPSVGRSIHDIFELLRPLEYWLLYRIARSTGDPIGVAEMTAAAVSTERPAPAASGVDDAPDGLGGYRSWLARNALHLIWISAIIVGLFSLAQYLDFARVNDVLTPIWTTGHNLDGVLRDGRAVGTTNSANLLGMLAACLAVAGLLGLLLRAAAGRWQLVTTLAAAAAVLSLVLSQSRGAALAASAAVFGAAFVVALTRRRARWLPAAGILAAATVVSVGLVFAVPTGTTNVAERFNFSTAGSDPSVVLRVARIRGLFATGGQPMSSAGLCSGNQPEPNVAGHELTTQTDPPAATPASRDEQRKRDVAAIADAIQRAFCATGHWPVSTDQLISDAMPALPADPSTGAPYSIDLGKSGYKVQARLEDANDPDGPLYVATSAPNLVLNSGFETGTIGSDWLTDSASTLAMTTDARFGQEAADINLAARGYLNQFVVYTMPTDTEFSASVWLRSAAGKDQTVRVYLAEVLADGTRISPAASALVVLPADGRWVRSTLGVRTPADGLVYIMQLLVTPAAVSPVHIQMDGATVTETSLAPAYAVTRDVDPAKVKGETPSFFASPLLGLGPLKNVELGGDPGEYLLILVKYGAIGLLAYLILFAATALTALLAWRRTRRAPSAIALTVLATTAGGAIFAATTATFYDYQLMAVFWLLVGLMLATAPPGESIVRSWPLRWPRGGNAMIGTPDR